MATMLSLRQVFLPFSTPLDPANPTDQQKKQLMAAQTIAKTRAQLRRRWRRPPRRPAAPARPTPARCGWRRWPPQMRALLAGLPPEQVSRPLVSTDGIGLIMICSSDQKNVAEGGNKEEIASRLLNDRVELVSRQLVRDLRRRAIIDMRG